jgi:hypothetical protein
MIPLRINEREHEDFDQPLVELWRDDDFVGYVFWDEDTPVVQIFLDEDGDPYDLDLQDLIRVLDTAERIVSPEAFGEDELEELRARVAAAGGEEDDGWGDEDPRIVSLFEEFDGRAAHRNEDGEGFFRRVDAEAFITRCNELDLAVIEMEGFDLDGPQLVQRPNLVLTVQTLSSIWESFRPQANFTALDTLGDWPKRESLVVAFVVQLQSGETRVA